MKKLLICFVVLAFALTAMPAMAAEKTMEERVKAIEECLECLWSFYGSVRMATFWTNENTVAADMYDRDEIQWDMQGNSRIGANVKAGDIAGRFEYGHDSAGGNNTTLRLLYATWNFGAGTLLIGQDYSPMFQLFADQVHGGDADLLNYGASLGRSRVPQIKLILGGFQFALTRPVERAATSAVAVADDAYCEIPSLEASYKHVFGPVSFTLFGGYNEYTEEDQMNAVTGQTRDYDIDSWALGLRVEFAQGPFYIKASGEMGENWAGIWTISTEAFNPIYTANQERDVDDYGFAVCAGFKVNDMLSFEAGYGYVNSERDKDITTAFGDDEDDAAAYYLNAKITIAKGFFIQPEIGKYDRKDNVVNNVTTEEVDQTYFGAKWQIDF